MPVLHFLVKADIVVGGRVHIIKAQAPAAPTSIFGGLKDLIDVRKAPAFSSQGDSPTFLLAAWLGGRSQALSLERINPDGTSLVKLDIAAGDVNHLKLGVSFNVQAPTVAPRPPRNYHLASSSIPMTDLVRLLKGAPDGDFDKCEQIFSMKDNFSRNTVLLRFANATTDLSAVAGLTLQPSALCQTDRLAEAVTRLGTDVHGKVARCDVNVSNAGPQYMDAFTYLPMEKALSHYALLGRAVTSRDSPIDLAYLMYAVYQTVHGTQLHPAALTAMPDHDFIAHFGNPMVSQQTSCDLTSSYSSDLSLNPVGAVTRVTEDIQSPLCGVAMRSQGVGASFVSRVDVSKLSEGECRRRVAEVVMAYGQPAVQPGMGGAIVLGDCEDMAQVPLAVIKALGVLYATLVARQKKGGDAALVDLLAERMTAVAAANSRLFSNLTPSDHALVAPVLLRLGQMAHSGSWDASLMVVSAKGPSYVANAAVQAPDALCGHAASLSRTTVGGVCAYQPLEGTAWIGMFNDPNTIQGLKGEPLRFATAVQVRVADGSLQTLPVADFFSALSQNVHDTVGCTPESRIKAHMPTCFAKGVDIMMQSPFYVAVFYSGLSRGPGTLGCVPVDTPSAAKRPLFGGLASSKPLFGAPVMGLSRDTTMAVPVEAKLLADPRKGDHAQLLTLLRQQWSEVWSPAADAETWGRIMSYWQPVRRPAWDGLRRDYGAFVRCENTWAFDDPDHVSMAVKIYDGLAAEFNRIQAATKGEDGVRADVHGRFRSVEFALTVGVPRVSGDAAPVLDLTCVRNLRAAVTSFMGMAAMVSNPAKTVPLQARARVPSEHMVYMCAQGGGMVHAHRLKLA